ncbi:hypothetical protein P154DRAFT_537877 [Amniculicola lignicola CBS 123094]|uniref:Uncharacterized protein n=1 Tax=Amniculicola lignicola CBS 123094 TaxID=1392246 RepID=A0A6A5W6F4_9PLEO|nr:hypothetical protein P154DRAFT_537877 [Amniculicola lignicola CBS 123094]
MAPPKLTDRGEPSVVPTSASPLRRSRLPTLLHVPILVVISLALRSALLPVATNFLGEELGAITKREDDTRFALGALAYKVIIICLGWYAKYDWMDISSLSVLSNAPYAYLVLTYFNISPLTIAAKIFIEVVATALPTFLLRAPSPIHNPNVPLRNRFLLESFQVQLSATLLAMGVYTTALWVGTKSGALSVFLVQHFDLVTLEEAHTETIPVLAAKIFFVGVAAKGFLLNDSIGAEASGASTPIEFDVATADLPATFKHNVWFFSKRTRALIRQTTILSFFMAANTVQSTYTLQGADLTGAAGYAGAWVLATAGCSAWWVWVGNTSVDV